jgi:predicted transcriptional regulator
MPSEPTDILSLTAKIVAAHLGNNEVDVDELPLLIRQVFQSLQKLQSSPGLPAQQEPAVPVNQSITPDYIVCLEDGHQLKMLKRYLRTTYNMTPQQYRDRWGLPADYPMVAPNYAKKRSRLAKSIGLGTRRRRRR